MTRRPETPMNRFSRCAHGLAAAALIALTSTTLAAQRAPAAATPFHPVEFAASIERARAFIRDTMASVGAPGASITVMHRSRVVWTEGFGWADLEQRVPVTALTKFRVGSVSKAITSVAMGRLVEEGKLDLDAVVQRYAPAFPTKRWPITVRQVAGHLAGVRHYLREDENNIVKRYANVGAALDLFKNDSLLFAPGTKFSYSSYGWNLLSVVIEGASGQRYLPYMQKSVFSPADMRNTIADHIDSIIPNRARWYTRGPNGGGIVNADFADNSYKWAGGGFLSTTDDLAELGDALLHGRLLKPETVQILWTSQKTRDGKNTDYGIGWSTELDGAGRRRVSHGGGSVGGTAFLLIYPDQDLVVALLINSDSTFVGTTPTIAEWFLAQVGAAR